MPTAPAAAPSPPTDWLSNAVTPPPSSVHFLASEFPDQRRRISAEEPALPSGFSPPPAPPPFHLFALGESMGAGIALQSAAADPRIEAVVAEASFASLREAHCLRLRRAYKKYPLLGKTFFAPGAWTMIYRGQSLAGFPASEVSPEKAVASRAFPVLLICDGADTTLPCRHTRRIYAAATGPKELWEVANAFHTAALGYQPEEFQRRCLAFFAAAAAAAAATSTPQK